MHELLQLMAFSALMILGAVVALWLLSIRIRDVSIIDMAYGLLIGAVALLAFVLAPAPGALQRLAVAACLIWVTRFSVHILRRNLGKGEDPRYTKLRTWVADERAFIWLSLRQVFLYQGVVIWLISLPLLMIMAAAPAQIGAVAVLGAAVWAVGVLMEAVADHQLTRFRADAASRGRILDTGLWRYSRHPNYFGDACVHWGIYLMACSVPWGFLSFVGPLAITHFLLNVTGMRLLEKKMLKEKPAYADYVKRTSGFIPLPPRSFRG